MVVALLTGCVGQVKDRCASCVVVDAAHPNLPEQLKPGTRTLYLIVPGVLGYGWEWDGAVDALRTAAGVDFAVFWWNPWQSLSKAAGELARVVQIALFTAPRSVREVVLVAHSAGGMVAAFAAGKLRVPPERRVRVVTIGAPFAGMMAMPFVEEDPVRSPTMIAVTGRFGAYPPVPPGVEVVQYVTAWPSDPVMRPLFGHQPAAPRIGPLPARRIPVDPKMDHNRFVSEIVLTLLKERR